MSDEFEADGEVTSMSVSSDGRHVNVSVVHGKKKKPTKAKPWDDRPTSSVYLSKAAAEAFNVGDKVTVCLEKADDGEDLDDMQRRLRVGRD